MEVISNPGQQGWGKRCSAWAFLTIAVGMLAWLQHLDVGSRA
jgi:hypothetical protein